MSASNEYGIARRTIFNLTKQEFEKLSPRELLSQFNSMSNGLPLQYRLRYFRKPKQLEDGTWNCRWLLPLLDTDSMGGVRTDDYHALSAQANIPFLADWIARGEIKPELTVTGRLAWRDMPDAPIETHIEYVYDLIDLDAAEQRNALTDDPNEAQPNLYAIVEQTTNMVIPVAANTRLTFTTYTDEFKASVKVSRIPVRRQSRNGWERYDDDYVEQHGFDEAQALHDIAVWEKILRAELARGRSPEFKEVMNRIIKLTERAHHDEHLNH